MQTKSQRDVMRSLVSKYGRHEDLVISAYAQAEQHGDVQRRRNTHGISPKKYARALWADGVAKRWF